MNFNVDLHNVAMRGRTAELGQLDAAFVGVSSSRKSAVVIIEGMSGTGKSFLVENWVSTNAPTLFASGKFDLNRQHCAASYEVLSEVVRELSEAVNDKMKLIKSLEEAFGDEIDLILDTLPSLPDFLRKKGGLKNDSSKQNLQYDSSTFSVDDGSVQRFKFLFLDFFRIVSQCLFKESAGSNPFVVFLDDLQYADRVSTGIVDSIVGDLELQGFLLILATHANRECIESSRLKADKGDWAFDIIRLGDLIIEYVNQIISEATMVRREKTLPLAQLILEKTGGNPFFVLQFLHLLQQRHILAFSGQSCTWEWDLDAARQQTQLAENVAAVVRVRVSALHPKEQKLLELAAYLGARFRVDSIRYIRQGLKTTKDTNGILEAVEALNSSTVVGGSHTPSESLNDSAFQTAVDKGLLEKICCGEFKFAHDSIQRSFLSPISAGECEEAQRRRVRIGAAILTLAQSSSDKEDLLFAAVEVLGQRVDTAYGAPDSPSKLYLATVHLDAAKLAIKRSAFYPASTYLETGVSLLSSMTNHWKNNYDLSSRLYGHAIKVMLACGKHEMCQEMAGNLLQNGNCLDDEVDACNAMASSLQAQNKNKEAFQVALDGLRLLGQYFPKKPNRFHVASSARIAKRLLTGKSADIIYALPMMTRNDHNCMKLMSTLLITSYQLSSWIFVALIARRMVALTLQEGLCKYSPLAFAAHAYKLVEERQFDEAYKYGELCNNLINSLNAKENLPLTTFFLATFVNHLRQPMQLGIKNLQRSHRIGMESGRTEMAFLCASTQVSYRFTVASPLSVLLHESRDYYNQCRQYSQDAMAGEFLIMCQFAANLRCESANATGFDGKFMSAEAEAMMSQLKIGPFREYVLYIQSVCCVFMADWPKALQGMNELQSSKKWGMNKRTSSHYSFFMMNIYSGIISLKTYKQTGNVYYKKRGVKAITFLQWWIQQGAMNMPPCLWLLQSQMALARGAGFQEAKILFDKAIAGLHRCAFRHLEALCCELLVEVAVEYDENDWATHYVQKACTLYKEWGAEAKVRQMREAFPSDLHHVDTNTDPSSKSVRSLRQQPGRASWWSDEMKLSVTDASWVV